MSGEEQIKEWVEDNYDPDDFVGYTAEEIYAKINERFIDDNRSDLDHILQNERNTFMEFIRHYFITKETKETQAVRIVNYLKRVKTEQTPKKIALALGIPQPSTRRTLQELVRQELIRRIRKGLYRF